MEQQIQQLNNSLAAAFTAKAAVIPDERLHELMDQLETLEEMLPDAADVEIDESMVLDLSGHQSSELEVVLEGGSMPTAAMVAWARELQVGGWYMLDYRNRNEAVQLAWLADAIVRAVHRVQARQSMHTAELSNYISKQHGRY